MTASLTAPAVGTGSKRGINVSNDLKLLDTYKKPFISGRRAQSDALNWRHGTARSIT